MSFFCPFSGILHICDSWTTAVQIFITNASNALGEARTRTAMQLTVSFFLQKKKIFFCNRMFITIIVCTKQYIWHAIFAVGTSSTLYM